MEYKVTIEYGGSEDVIVNADSRVEASREALRQITGSYEITDVIVEEIK